MDLNQYVQDAIRTESRIDSVVTNPDTLLHALNALIAVGSILDLLKKNTFYKKPIDAVTYGDLWNALSHHTAMLGLENMDRVDGEHAQKIKIEPRIFHAIIGAITEAAELAEALKKAICSSDNIDLVNVLEEFGDINWYQAIAVDTLNGDFQKILERNIAKLKKRFPEKFTHENAINRNLQVERAVLEGK